MLASAHIVLLLVVAAERSTAVLERIKLMHRRDRRKWGCFEFLDWFAGPPPK